MFVAPGRPGHSWAFSLRSSWRTFTGVLAFSARTSGSTECASSFKADVKSRNVEMRFRDRVYFVFDDLKTSSAADVAKTASRLGVTFPGGYAEYVTELGQG